MLAVEFCGRQAEFLPPQRQFLPYRVELTKSLSTPFRAVVHGLTPDLWEYAHDQALGDRDVEPHPDRFLRLPTRLTIRAEGSVRLLRGVVMGARQDTPGGARLADDGTVHAGKTSADGLTKTITDTLTRTLRAHVLDHPL
jgi:hypothetical protein